VYMVFETLARPCANVGVLAGDDAR